MPSGIFDTVCIVPPHKIEKFYYLCDSRFHTEYIEELFQDAENTYGIVLVYGEEAEFYTMDEKFRHKFHSRIKHRIGNNHRRGGQSQNRLHRLRDEQIHNYISMLEEEAKSLYTFDGVTTVKKIVLSGPGFKKEQLRDSLKDVVSCPIVLSTELDFDSLKDKFREIVQDDAHLDSKVQMEKIKEYMRTEPDRLVYGSVDIKEELNNGTIQQLWVTDKNQWQNLGIEVRQVSDGYLDNFDGVMGLKWPGVGSEESM